MQLIRSSGLVLGLAAASVQASETGMSPVTRVVQLLQGMSVRIEKDGKAEEDLYETFVCWAKSIISQKTQSNTAAQSRVDYLATYIDDLQNGRIELTTERVDLEKEIETLTGDIEVATRLRDKEAADYADAKEEMEAGIKALTQAIDVLRDATKDHKDGVLLRLKNSVGEGFSARAQEAISLHKAVELGERVLTKGDSVFLTRLLTGEPPERASWKKLNRKATFKMDYKARSFKIQGVLAELLETFAGNLKDATAKEKEAVDSFNKLMKAKGDEKSAAQDALAKMDKENGARALSMDDAVEEKNGLTTQISDDEGYIAQVEKALADKKAEWKTRKELRTGEIAAISKAISILHSDDARDLMKRSYASQGFLFLQEGAKSTSGRAEGATQALRALARQSSDARLVALASMASTGHFDEVIKAIDSMMQVLKDEEATDLQNKEDCEDTRANDTRSAIKTSREMDELSETIFALEAKIKELTAEIKEKEVRVEEIKVELVQIKEQRDKENAEFLVNKQDDVDAAALVEQSKNVLESFYKDNGLMLVQKKQKQPFESTAGEAPPPPPKTWDGAYGGKTEESTGIIAILGMIHDDILKDVSKAEKEEAAALKLYTETKDDLTAEKNKLTTSIDELSQSRSTAMTDVQTNTQDRTAKNDELKVVMKKIKDNAPGCAFVQINFGLRSKNRQIEIDGLQKAKAILSGGVFDGKDPNREIKPGDAFLMQGHLRAGKVNRH